MPGVGMRACSSSTKVFQAARSGRGSMVTMTVSSTSESTPNVTEGSTTLSGASTATDFCGAERGRVPAGREDHLHHGVDDATPVRDQLETLAGDVNGDPGVADGHAREAAPAAHARAAALARRLARACRLRVGGRESRTRHEDAHPAVAAVAGVRDHRLAEPALAGGAVTPGVRPVLDAGGPVRGRGRAQGRIARFAGVDHESSLSRPRGTPCTRGVHETCSAPLK